MSSSPVREHVVNLELKNVEEQRKILRELYCIWNNVGVEEEQQEKRAKQVWGYVFDLLKDILKEETELYEDIKERIKNYQKKILELLNELSLPKREEIDGTLIVKEETLRQQLDELSKIKHKRLKEFQELHSLEMEYCNLLGMPALNVSSTTGVPSEKDISELQEYVNMLTKEKDKRLKKFNLLKKELTTILEVTELAPETPLEKEILGSKEYNLSLSAETYTLLEEIVTKTKSKKAELEKERDVLMDKLNMLWDLLKVEKEEREKFLSQHICCRISSIKAIKDEIARCEDMKKKNIKKYIDALKEELSSLCKKCFISQPRLAFELYDSDEINEDTLELFDKEVAKWRKYYKDTKHIIQKIKKRQELWDLMVVFENKANDPNRYKNRGGNLLQEERERKKLQKDLPALENEILCDIDKYEEESGRQFLYYGENVRDLLTKQWQDRITEKENKKQTRRKLRVDQLIEEQITAKRPCITTPKSAPSKLLKSSAVTSIYHTPVFSMPKQMACSSAKVRTHKLLRLQSNSNKKTDGNVLREKNVCHSENSDSHNTTTYSEFAQILDNSSRYPLRSSVLSSRKNISSRISKSKKSEMKSSISIRKSSQRLINSSKITPIRGKLGLPFLI